MKTEILSIKLSAHLQRLLHELCELTGKNKSEITREALESCMRGYGITFIQGGVYVD